MVHLCADVLYRAGGVETYLHALATHLQRVRVPFRVVVTELERCPLVDELAARKIDVYRQRRLPGDRWLVRQHVMGLALWRRLRRGDWVFCVRQPSPELYPWLVRLVHGRGARLAASWALAPEFLPPPTPDFSRAVARTDAVVSVSRAAAGQYRRVYGYEGPVHVVPYHNLPFFDAPPPLPPGPPWKIAYLGRLETRQKSLDRLVAAFAGLTRLRPDVELHFHGGGPDRAALEAQAQEAGVRRGVHFHGAYDHRRDLAGILAGCHLGVYASRYEGGPCFSLLETMQAGRYCVASAVGGIPDLYENHPEAGLLVPRDFDIHVLTRTLGEAIDRVVAGRVMADAVRARYFEGGFDLASAHRAWTAALNLHA